MGTALISLTSQLARTLAVAGADNEQMAGELLETLKATVFRGEGGRAPSDAQLTALMVIAQQYKLNPWTKEIYAFPDKGGIVPVVGVDGWLRIINGRPEFDGMEYADGPAAPEGSNNKGLPEWIECVIFRKDRAHPIKVREYMVECRKGNTGPWQSHPRRMLRHKATIQCARVAFGFAGIYDDDEAARIVEARAGEAPAPGATVVVDANAPAPTQPPKPAYPDEKFEFNFAKWKGVISSGSRTAKNYIEWLEEGHTLTAAQRKRLQDCEPQAAVDVEPKPPADTPAPSTGPVPDAATGEIAVTYAEVAHAIAHATSMEALAEAGDLIRYVPDVDGHRAELQATYDRTEVDMKKKAAK